MKTTKLLIIALVLGAMAASSAIAQTVARTSARPSFAASRTVASNWNHHRYYRPRSNFYFGIGLGYPYSGYGYGYPYYGGYRGGRGYGATGYGYSVGRGWSYNHQPTVDRSPHAELPPTK